MKKLKLKVATVVFELIGCANSEMNAVFCKGVLVGAVFLVLVAEHSVTGAVVAFSP